MTPNDMEVLYNVRFLVIHVGREADVYKYGDDRLRVNATLECPNTGTRIILRDVLLGDHPDYYEKIMKAYRNHEHIQVFLTTDFLKLKGPQKPEKSQSSSSSNLGLTYANEPTMRNLRKEHATIACWSCEHCNNVWYMSGAPQVCPHCYASSSLKRDQPVP